MFIGNLGNDPDGGEGKDSGRFWATFSIATTNKWKDKDGNQHEETEWTKVKCFGKLAEVVLNHCRKGMKVFVCGRKQTREHEGKYFTDILMSNFDDFSILSWNDDKAPEAPKSTTEDSF